MDDHETPATVLAIDAGNSKTDVAIVAADGTVRGTARGGSGIDGEGPVARHVSACLANADLPVEHEALESAIVAQGWGGSIEVFNDTFALLRAGLDERRGVAVVCGAGCPRHCGRYAAPHT